MKTTLNTPRQKAIAASVLSLLLGLPVYSATFTLNPSMDAFVTTGPSGNLSGNNYGGAGALSVAAPGLPNGEFQSVLQFNLSGAVTSFNTQFGAGQWNIQSITLSLTATSPNNAIFNSSAAGQFGISWMQNDSWTEGTGTPAAPTTTGITYSSLPSYTGAGDESLGTFSFAGGTSGSATYTLSLTPGFLADASAGDLVSFRLFAADTAVSYLFDSRNFGTASARPLLTVVAVPEPAALPLLAVGAALLFRRKASPPKIAANDTPPSQGGLKLTGPRAVPARSAHNTCGGAPENQNVREAVGIAASRDGSRSDPEADARPALRHVPPSASSSCSLSSLSSRSWRRCSCRP